ncbi:MAG: DNA-binding protein [archaeon]|nr:DNA-binding protein [archaeon]
MEDDPELAALRQKRMAEMQQQAQQQAQQQEQAKQIEAQKQSILRQIMEPEARDRLANIKLANPQMAANVESQLIRLSQSGRLQGMITDSMLREILQSMTPQKREIKIERR